MCMIFVGPQMEITWHLLLWITQQSCGMSTKVNAAVIPWNSRSAGISPQKMGNIIFYYCFPVWFSQGVCEGPLSIDIKYSQANRIYTWGICSPWSIQEITSHIFYPPKLLHKLPTSLFGVVQHGLSCGCVFPFEKLFIFFDTWQLLVFLCKKATLK